MNNKEFRKFTYSIVAYLETGSEQKLEKLQYYIKNNEGCREMLVKDVIEHHERYIQVFSTEDQVEIVSDLIAQIKKNENLASRVTWLLPYVSNEALKQILSRADDDALSLIIMQIEKNIKAIGKRYCDSPKYSCLSLCDSVQVSCMYSTNFWSRMNERVRWRNLRKKCKKNLR